MAKLKVTGLNKVESSIRKRITKALRDKDIREGVGEIIVEEIQDNSIPVSSAATKAWRKYLEKGNKTSKKYSRNKINFTFTGDLMEDLRKNVKADFSKSKFSYVIEHSDKRHKKYKKPNGKTVKGEPQTFKQIYGYISSLKFEYDYLVFTNKAKKRVLKFIQEAVFKRLGD